MDTGRSITPSAAVIRNLVRLLDCYFPGLPFAPALVTMFFHPSNKRPGDMVGGTIVVRDRPTDWMLGAQALAAEPAPEPIETGPPELSEDEFRLLDRFLARLSDLAPDVQVRITADLVRRFQGGIPRPRLDPQGHFRTGFPPGERQPSRPFPAPPPKAGGGR